MNVVLLSCLFLLLVVPSETHAIPDAWPAPSENYVKHTIAGNKYVPSAIVYLPRTVLVEDKVVRRGSVDYYAIVFTQGAVSYKVTFNMGASEDPTYVVEATVGKENVSTEISAESLLVAESGDIYTYTRMNENYPKRSHYRMTKDGMIEQRQPYYLVDLQCDANESLSLHTERCGQGETVALVPAGSPVRVLLAESERGQNQCSADPKDIDGLSVLNVLVATSLGEVGWARVQSGYLQTPGRPLPCIILVGD